jgi:hypothetical protein
METRDQDLAAQHQNAQSKPEKRRFKLVRLEERIAPGGTLTVGCPTSANICTGHAYTTQTTCCG